MDQDRQIRFAIPPFFLFASLLWGAHLGHRNLSSFFTPEATKGVLELLAATAVAIVPAGFLIGTLSVVILRLIALISGSPTYEAVLNDSTLGRVWDQLKSTLPKNKDLVLYAAVTFDHELLTKGAHEWVFRRWNSFNIAAHSIVALLLAHVLGPIFSIPQSCPWCISTAAIVAVLFVNALCSWRETMQMIQFQSYRQQNGDAKK